ncbi:MAG: cytochrome ubiquinol oxidase subunit [Firmicutes bacterium]|nr:cytochrome ubiquinol oxidase subunit [Bacillota bacterium]
MINNISAARFQMGYSLGFHMIFAALGVGMPALMLIAEALWLRSRKPEYQKLAQTWAKATGLLFAIGAVSGTALSFELGLLWPRFMAFAGGTIGPAFTLEGYAFFTEAIFLGLYLYGWERLSGPAHWFSGLVVALSGAASSILVVAADAWMQTPVGVQDLISRPQTFNAARALFTNEAWWIMSIHSTLACYAATAFAAAGVYAWGAVVRGRKDDLRMRALAICMAVGVISAVAMPITGHESAISVARRQPNKLASMESLFRTQRGAPLLVGGIPDPAHQRVLFGIEIPKGLSFLATFNPNAEVQGLDRVPRDEWPNLYVTHFSFQAMVGAGMITMLVAIWYWIAARRRNGTKDNRLLQWALVVCSPLGFVSLEAGWIVTEVGRQPWIIYRVMRTAAAVTPAQGIGGSVTGFIVLYTLLGVALVWMLNRIKHPAA